MNENAASRASAIRCPGGLRARRAGRGRGKREGACERQDAGAVGVRLDEVGDGLKPRLESVRLARLNEAEMALGQRDFFVARQRADDGDAERLDRLVTSRRWRSLPTRLTTTPAIARRGS